MTQVDLMDDVGFFADRKVEKVVHILARDGGGFDVVVGDKIADGLTWGEMLEQVIAITAPSPLKSYPMDTREGLAERMRKQGAKADFNEVEKSK